MYVAGLGIMYQVGQFSNGTGLKFRRTIYGKDNTRYLGIWLKEQRLSHIPYM